MTKRIQILVRGIVQGVGFRPFIFSLANQNSLKGQVCNNTSGVLIDVEGDGAAIEQFINEIKKSPPRLSRVESIHRSSDLSLAHYNDFRIVESSAEGEESLVPVSPDVATCADCLRELFCPQDRRYRYPFINCTNCGPRFSIIEAIPYERRRTTMRDFPLCAACRAEYKNPLDRRFHAEPIACPACGPRLRLVDSKESEIVLDPMRRIADAITVTRQLLLDGKIVAVKGIGGFHLACDALNQEAVARLRQKKYREDKPFAMMAGSVEVIRKYCLVSGREEDLLMQESGPIILLKKRPALILPVEIIAPRIDLLGFMLPYSPLHHLLLENIDRPLVMTSGNISDEPVSYENGEALERLRNVADYFLLHDRRIYMRTDDSVARVFEEREVILRRARGYAPRPVETAFKFGREILACGGELKNTFCLTRENHAFLSHHIGDLENLETLQSFEQGIEHFKRLFYLRPEVVAYDLHPEYLSTKYALALDGISTRIGIQHHHAHIASCMADNRIEGDVIGVAMDGLGFGTDGRMWGGEFFVANFIEAERRAHLEYIPLPGGAKAIREPWRMAAIYLQRSFGDEFLKLNLPAVQKINQSSWRALRSMVRAGTNCPETSSMGRLFDAMSSILNLRDTVNYEGQAAVELEAIADPCCVQGYEFEVAEKGSIIKADTVIRRAVEDALDGVSPQIISAKFHLGVAHLIAHIARQLRDERRLNRVVLSGGVFQNIFLLRKASQLLKLDGFEVFTHHRVPTNDGGISFGQATVANAALASGRI